MKSPFSHLNYFAFFLVFLVSCGPRQTEKPEEVPEANNIRHYLSRVATDISNDFGSGTESLSDLENSRDQEYNEFIEMMGLPMEKDRNPPKVTFTGTIQEAGYRIEKFYYESLPGLYVPANLYIPDDIQEPRPAIIYVCGHSHGQKAHYQAHPRKLAELGFVTLIFETLQFGEVWGHHWGPYSKGWFHWYSRGYNPAAVELWNGIRGLDYLATRPEVDMDNIGVTGISGGGSQSWYFPAADPRIKAAAPVCGANLLKSQVGDRVIDGHCDCMMPNNGFQIDFNDIGALIAPRPLLIAQSDQDELNDIEIVKELHQELKTTYGHYGAEDQLSLVITPGGHSYHQKSREAIFSFFMKHLMGKEVPPHEIGDITVNPNELIPEDSLAVYKDGPPPNDKTTTIQDEFILLPAPPAIASESDLMAFQDTVRSYLKTRTFGAFPTSPIDLNGKLEFQTADLAKFGRSTYSYITEEGWRIKLELFYHRDPNNEQPLTMILRSPGEERWASEGFANRIARGENVAYVEVRGVGEFGWAPELNWHVRRAAAWTGRTIASMQVYDALRSLEFIRTLPGVNPKKVSIAGRDGMGAVALYAAFLDEKCEQVIVHNPPETHDQPSPVNGRDFPLEMLNVLRITDLYQLPALVSPTRTVFEGEIPEAYTWSDEVLKNSGREPLSKAL